MARVITYDDPVAFRERVEPFLLADEARNNLLFGILHAIALGRYRDVLLCALEDGDDIAAVALRTAPHPLVLSVASPEATRTLAETLEIAGLTGVNAEIEQARAFADAWTARTGAPSRRGMGLGVYALTTVRRPEGVRGRARPLEERDRDVVRGWLRGFEEEALASDDPGRGFADLRVDRALSDPDSALLLWEVDGEPVCVAGMAGPTPNGMRIGPVYTPPERRRNGYAAALTADLSARLLDAGRTFCFLFTDLANPTSNGVYRRIGYEHIGDAAVYRFG